MGQVSVRVVPVSHQPHDEELRQQRSTLKQEIAALKWQKNICQTLIKNSQSSNTSDRQHRVQRNQTWRTQRAKEIQSNHEKGRSLVLKNIEQQHSERRSSLQARVQARNKKREGGEAVNNQVDMAKGMTTNVVGAGGATSVQSREIRNDGVENIRRILHKCMKTQRKLQRWMARCDTTSSGLLSRLDFAQLVRKAVSKVGQGEVDVEFAADVWTKESLMEGIWTSVKKGTSSGKGVAWDVVEHVVVEHWVFARNKKKEDRRKGSSGAALSLDDPMVQNVDTEVKVDKPAKIGSERMLKSVRLQQRIQSIKEVQMRRVKEKRLAKGEE